jgi:hypothetical protein
MSREAFSSNETFIAIGFMAAVTLFACLCVSQWLETTRTEIKYQSMYSTDTVYVDTAHVE